MLTRVVIDNIKLFDKKLQWWENFYNYNRPYADLGGRAPYEQLMEKGKLYA